MRFAALVGLSGALLGFYMVIHAHSRFLRSLEDFDGFIEAVSNVERRLGTLDTSREAYLRKSQIFTVSQVPF